MASKAYAVCEVELKKESILSILCSSWLIPPDNEISQSYCLWPLKEELAVCYLVMLGCKPERDWVRYKCKILFECSMF